MQISYSYSNGTRVVDGKTVMEFDESSKLSIETGSFSELAKLTEIDSVETMEYVLDCDDESLERIINAIGKEAFINRILRVSKLRRVALLPMPTDSETTGTNVKWKNRRLLILRKRKYRLMRLWIAYQKNYCAWI